MVVSIAQAAGDAAVEFDEAVDGFGAAGGRAVGVEVAVCTVATMVSATARPAAWLSWW